MRGAVAITFLLSASCAPSPPHVAGVDRARAAVIEQLCAQLPENASDCVVGWPASVSRARRDSVASASEGSVWANAPGVRAYASCTDRAAGAGNVAHIVTLLLDPSRGSAEEIAERLPVRVRWNAACASEVDDCASYVAHFEHDVLRLTRLEWTGRGDDTRIARVACAAVTEGAIEAHARLDEGDALVRELHADDTGIAIIRRSTDGRGERDRTHRSWTELDLDARDERLETESTMRAAASARPIDPERVDVTNVNALDVQVNARLRRIARDRSESALRDLARLAERGFEAHPSRPELGVLAIERSVEAGDAQRARVVLTSLAAVLGDGDGEVRRLALVVAVAERDTEAVATALLASHPELLGNDVTVLAGTLVDGRSSLDATAIATLPSAARALIGAALAVSFSGVPVRSRPTITPAWATPWALAALSNGEATGLVTVCGGAPRDERVSRVSTSRGGVLTVGVVGHCAAAVADVDSSFDLASAAHALLDGAVGAVRLSIEIDGHFRASVGGTLDAAGTLRIERIELAASDAHAVARAQREVVTPLVAVGSRVFPAPEITVPLAAERRPAAIAAAAAIEGVACRAIETGVTCALESGESVDRLVDVAIAMFRAGR